MPKRRGLRRVPSQERSRKRFEAILAAAAEVFAEVGFDATTMEAIAERAETSVGSLYQFVPNKRALFRAIGERCVERSAEVFAELLGDDPTSRPWSELLDTVVDGFADLYEHDPAFRAVWVNFQLYGEYAEADRALEGQIITVTATLVGAWAPHMAPRRREVVATVVVDVIGAMLVVSMRGSPKQTRRILDETKLMIRRYLEQEVSR